MRPKMQTMRLPGAYLEAWASRRAAQQTKVVERRHSVAQTPSAAVSTSPRSFSNSSSSCANDEEFGMWIRACQRLLEVCGDHERSPSSQRHSEWLQHDCSKRCEFEQFEDLWICKTTGCVHHCTQQHCTQSHPTSSGRFCAISGRSFEELQHYEPRHDDDEEAPVHYPYKGEGLATVDMPFAQLVKQLITVESLNCRKRKQHQLQQQRLLNGPASKTRKRSSGSSGRSGGGHKSTEVDPEHLERMCGHFLHEATDRKLAPDDHSRIVRAIMRCWQLVRSTQHAKQHRSHYKFTFHVHACMYECIDGFSTDRDEYLPQMPVLRDTLMRKPLLLKRDQQRAQRLGAEAKSSQLTAAKLTHATRILHMSIAELES